MKKSSEDTRIPQDCLADLKLNSLCHRLETRDTSLEVVQCHDGDTPSKCSHAAHVWRMGPIGAGRLAGAMKDSPTARELWMQRNWIELEGAIHIASAIRTCSRLQKIGLAWNGIGDVGTRHICQAAEACPESKSLGLAGNRIGQEGAGSVAEAIGALPQLATLGLGNNRIGAQGALALSDALASGRSKLKELDLTYNEIDDAGAQHLARGIAACRHLTTLILLDNEIGDAGAMALVNGIKYCRKLKHVLVEGNPISPGAEAALNARVGGLHTQRCRCIAMVASLRHVPVSPFGNNLEPEFIQQMANATWWLFECC